MMPLQLAACGDAALAMCGGDHIRRVDACADLTEQCSAPGAAITGSRRHVISSR